MFLVVIPRAYIEMIYLVIETLEPGFPPWDDNRGKGRVAVPRGSKVDFTEIPFDFLLVKFSKFRLSLKENDYRIDCIYPCLFLTNLVLLCIGTMK